MGMPEEASKQSDGGAWKKTKGTFGKAMQSIRIPYRNQGGFVKDINGNALRQ